MKKNEIKLGAVIGYINVICSILISLLYVPFMLKTMGKSEYGLYSLVSSVIAYLSILDLGFGNAMVRFVSRNQARKENQESKINGLFLFLYTIIGVIALLIGIGLIFFSDSIFGASLNPYELQKIKVLLLILVINVALSFPLSVFDSYIIANEKFVYTKVLTLIKTLFRPLIMIPLLLYGYKSIAMTSVTAGLNIAFHLAMLIYCFKVLKIKFTFNIKNIDNKLLKDIFAYSFFIFLNIIVDRVFTSTDQIILGIVSGTVAVSIYSVAQQISEMNNQFSTIISGLFLPRITKLLEEKDSDKKVSDLFIQVSRIQIYVMMLILFGFITFGKYFITSIWLDESYVEAYYIILIIIIPSIIPLTQNIGISVIQARNIHQFRSIMYIIIALLNVGMSIPLAMHYQGIGAAIGTAFANICGQIITMNIFYYKKAKLDIPKYWVNFIKMAFQYTVLTVVSMLILNNIGFNKYNFFIGIAVFTIIYVVITYLNMNNYEKETLNKIIKKFTKRKLKES